jgi:hypothetical protein
MAHQVRAALKRQCIDYKSPFLHSELERVKLTQTYADGSTKVKKCPVFSGEHGIESLLLVCGRKIQESCSTITIWYGAELFDNFEEILTDYAEEKWENLVSGIEVAAHTVPCFDVEMRNDYLRYVDDEARDIMFKYLRTCKKPSEAEPRTHVDQMEMLMRYSNNLPGTEPPLNEQQRNNLILLLILWPLLSSTWVMRKTLQMWTTRLQSKWRENQKNKAKVAISSAWEEVMKRKRRMVTTIKANPVPMILAHGVDQGTSGDNALITQTATAFIIVMFMEELVQALSEAVATMEDVEAVVVVVVEATMEVETVVMDPITMRTITINNVKAMVMDRHLTRIIICKPLHRVHLKKAGLPNHIILIELAMEGLFKDEAGMDMDTGVLTKEAGGDPL